MGAIRETSATTAAGPGKVFIVGAGPGNPELLTVRAANLVRDAQVIIHDHLVGPAILALASPSVPKVCLSCPGSTPGHGSALKQNATHRAMARYARLGHSVVRLKSGDPLIFGRGGEEAEFLEREGIPWEIVPGITAALGCAAAAGLALTHRGYSSSVTFVTGHGAEGSQTPEAGGWDRLPLGGTVAVYMGVGNMARVADDLVLRSGFDRTTPALVVEKGGGPGERIVMGILGDIAARAAAADIASPAVLFVGAAAGSAAVKAQAARRERPAAQKGRRYGSGAQGF